MNTKNITLDTIESDIDKLKHDLAVFIEGKKKITRDPESVKDAVINNMDRLSVAGEITDTYKRISKLLKEVNDVLIIDINVPTMKSTIADKLKSLPKLDAASIACFKEGIAKSRSMKLPDSAWEE